MQKNPDWEGPGAAPDPWGPTLHSTSRKLALWPCPAPTGSGPSSRGPCGNRVSLPGQARAHRPNPTEEALATRPMRGAEAGQQGGAPGLGWPEASVKQRVEGH